ncbi:hypothetical protein BUALT_Bualt07G0133800 [Buddleja alternifolia]|uniref:RNase H type-1 domain-containing protein n=1 Tax=Buddleja alternifolia TaxID=168488 RepID=A0AAV6XEV5_9LAMI|nr:hypothetical protein BUALT_Bualt07G0133800 [Buddleja alternifolia]
MDRDNFALVLVICWSIWSSRNKALWEGKLLNQANTCAHATAFLSSFKERLGKLLLAVRRSWHSIIIEGDCIQVIQKLQRSVSDCSNINPIILDILSLVSSFLSCLYSHVRRSGNRVAHCYARLLSSFSVGCNVIPVSVATSISADIASSINNIVWSLKSKVKSGMNCITSCPTFS